MIQPIKKEHELICPCGCGCVMAIIDESPQMYNDTKQTIPPGLNVFLLGSAISTSRNYYFNKDRSQIYYERALQRLVDITKEYALPDRIAYATMNVIKKNKRGLYSFHEQIKQLLLILSKDENYIYFPKMRAIKARYENVSKV